MNSCVSYSISKRNLKKISTGFLGKETITVAGIGSFVQEGNPEEEKNGGFFLSVNRSVKEGNNKFFSIFRENFEILIKIQISSIEVKKEIDNELVLEIDIKENIFSLKFKDFFDYKNFKKWMNIFKNLEKGKIIFPQLAYLH